MKDKAKRDFQDTNELAINVDMAIVLGLSGFFASEGHILGAVAGVATSIAVDCLSHWENKKFKPKDPTPK